ncbi:hypothetical protein K431DRAFT_282907 [Polychaeton citri CBS 116435]|uniref:RRM domain-containing protein n=1 Tax=Polychaeton citri CBS 116435 TaxID=1314669 RepID=A0A9P4USA4_9PEZI|nr:hypothetical protein K431DRAFT_282907 [Polychaeton citri CBS 116435]
MTSGPPPEEPTLRSSPCLLSPTSPKPIHLPTPTSIPILEMQNDVEFNQTELHMNDPAMHNTELRPGAWKDPAEHAAGEASAQPSVREGPTGDDGVPSQEKATATTLPRESSVQDQQGSSEPQQSALADQPDLSMPSDSGAHPDPQALTASQSGFAAQVVSPQAQRATAYPDDFSSQTDEVKLEGDASTISGSVDVQSLLTSLQTASGAAASGAATAVAEGASNAAPASPSIQDQQQSHHNVASPLSASGPGPLAGLPPRPPPQEQPLIHPNYVHSQHIRDYHPHAANPAFQPHGRSDSSGNVTDTPSVSGDTKNASFQQTPVPATVPFQNPIVSTPQSATVDSRRENYLLSGEPKKLEDAPWTPDTQRKYDQFIETERNYVQQGRWEQFPNGSRLFVGNLSSEKVTKRDIFHVFHPYGDLAQISIKQAYGFVQFFSAEDCARALAVEQGRQIRDKRIRMYRVQEQLAHGVLLTCS